MKNVFALKEILVKDRSHVALKKKDLSIVIILLLLILLPFCNKAYHIDDPMVIYPARQILNEPLNPLNFHVNWLGVPRTLWEEGNPPLIFYYVALFIKNFGESEIVLHIAFLIFAITCGISMYFLGLRFTKWPFLSSLFLITTPAFLVMSTNIMLDVPLLAFYMASIATFVYGVDRDNNRLKVLSGIFIGITVLTKYAGLTLVPLLLIYLIMRGKNDWKSLWILVIPIFIFALWCIHNLITHGTMHFIKTSGYLDFKPDALYQKLIGTLIYLGSATVFPLFIPVLLFTKRKDILIWIFAIFVAVLLPSRLWANFDYGPIPKFFMRFFIWVAVIFLIKSIERIIQIFLQYLKNLRIKESNTQIADNTLFLLWFLGIFLINVIAEFAAVRFVLLMLPPMILVGMKMSEEGFICGRKQFKDLVVIIGLLSALALSVSVVYADYNYANVYRLYVKKINGSLKGKKSNIYFSAHWGFQYYMEKEGFKCFSPKIDNPKKGDILVIPYIASYDMPIDVSSKEQLESYLGRHLKLIETVEYNSRFSVRTMHRQAHAGFYSHGWGFLPFAFSRAYLERFYIWEFI